jgi:drug/metabolite transporter (DMT)-like permease
MRHPSLGIALKIAATLGFSATYATIKLAGDVPVGEVIFFRGAFALVPIFALSVYTVGPWAIMRTTRPILHLRRAAVGLTSMFLNFAAVQRLPLADVTAFGFAMPIFAVVLAAIVLREQIGAFRWGAVLAGFCGVLLMVEPHGGFATLFAAGFSTGAGMALGGAFLSAMVVIFIRQMSTTERSETIVLYFMAVSAAVGAVTLLWARVPLTGMQTLWLVLCGLFGGVGQVCMTYSYRYAEPSLLAPFDYTAMIWAVTIGFLVFAEVPKTMVLAGAAVVTAAGLFIVWRERRLHQRTRAAPAIL